MEDYRKIAINGYVTIKNGDRVIVDRGKNAIVRQGMRHFIALMSHNLSRIGGSSSGGRTHSWYFGSYDPIMKFGNNSGVTTQLMDGLVSELNQAQTSIINIQGALNLGNGIVLTRYVANFAAGLLNAKLNEGDTLGEVGLWLQLEDKFVVGDNITPTLYNDNDYITYTSPTLMFARYSLGDDAFVPSEIAPVIVEWEFRWEFI